MAKGKDNNYGPISSLKFKRHLRVGCFVYFRLSSRHDPPPSTRGKGTVTVDMVQKRASPKKERVEVLRDKCVTLFFHDGTDEGRGGMRTIDDSAEAPCVRLCYQTGFDNPDMKPMKSEVNDVALRIPEKHVFV